jgi:hypothetical protein
MVLIVDLEKAEGPRYEVDYFAEKGDFLKHVIGCIYQAFRKETDLGGERLTSPLPCNG